MSNIRLSWLVVVLLIIPISVWANPAVNKLDTGVLKVDLLHTLEVLQVPFDQRLSEVKQHQNWVKFDRALSLNNEQALWGRSRIKLTSPNQSRWVFVINNAGLDFLDIFLIDARGRIRHSAMVGSQRPLENRPFRYHEFALPFNLESNEEVEIYFKIQHSGPLVFSARLWSSNALIAYEQRNQVFVGIFTGALLVLACYFLITYLLLRSPVRFWFAVSNLTFVLLFLNAEGTLGMFTGYTLHMADITSVLLALAVFCSGKVSLALLTGVPRKWRYVSVFGAALLVGSIFFNTTMQIIVAGGVGTIILGMQLILSFCFHNPYNSLPNKFFALGWVTISTFVLLDTLLFLNGHLLTIRESLLLNSVLLGGVLLIGVAVEAHERVLLRNRHEQQANVISDLRRFYEFFRNSAEGHFTSSGHNGDLITVNPAMCTLFGYEDEAEILQQRPNINDLFVENDELDILIQQLAKEQTAIGREIRGIKKDGTEFWLSMTVNMREDEGAQLFFGSVVDITERKQTHISLAYLATHDPLTGIYNRRHFENELKDALREVCKVNGALTLMDLDLEQFKAVNDTCGHKAGDILLKDIAQKLDARLGDRGILGRMGGDEFSVLLVGDNAKLALEIGKDLREVIHLHRFIWESRLFSIGVSVGAVHWQPGISSSEQILSMADSACYFAKELGSNQIHVYSQEDEHMRRYEMELNWLSHINKALDSGNFVLFFQSYRSLKSVDQGFHYEILVRIKAQDGHVSLPGSFLPAAERYKLIAKIDRWVINHYFEWLSNHPTHLKELECCNINLSGQSLSDSDLLLFIHDAFQKYQIPHHKICFEITESMAIVKLDDTLRFMKTFRKLGCQFALDDFGVGFSSYEYLKKLPVDMVKIDGSFVKNLINDPIDRAMVNSIRDVASAMGMQTVAEYVENSDIMMELGKIGVDYAQGYGVAKPRPLKTENFITQQEIRT